MTRYRRKQKTTVVAIQLAIDTDGLSYRKWGSVQLAKSGDWLVKNGEDVYTVDADSFRNTYHQVSDGIYEKTGNIWAERVEVAGAIQTKEGATNYRAGDYLVSNNPDNTDRYAISADKFAQLYEPWPQLAP